MTPNFWDLRAEVGRPGKRVEGLSFADGLKALEKARDAGAELALGRWARARALLPRVADARRRAALLDVLGEVEAAARLLARARLPEAAEACERAGLYDEAEALFRARGAGEDAARLERWRKGAAGGDGDEAEVWRAEGLRRRGRDAECARLCARVLARRPGHLAAALNRVLALREPSEAQSLPLRQLGVDRAGARALLARMGGNRSASPTIVVAGRLRRFEPPNPRRAMVEAQLRLAFEAPEEVLAALSRDGRDAVETARWRVHRGEVLLWLGRPVEALADMEAARRVAHLAWPYVGAAACHVLLGGLAEASSLLKQAAKKGAPERVRAPWLAELARRAGKSAEAARILKAYASPGGDAFAEVSLALLDRGGRKERGERLARERYALIASAAVDVGLGKSRPGGALAPDILERALASLQGNRSHTLATWLSVQGRPRVLDLRRP